MIRRLFLAAALASLLAVAAFPQGKKGGGGGGGFGGGFPGRGPMADKSQALTDEFKLTPVQKTQLEAIFDDAQKQISPLVKQATDEQDRLLAAAMKGADAAASVQKLAAIRAQIKNAEVDAFNKALAVFDSKQKQKAAKLYTMIAGMFVGGNWRRTT